MWARAAQPWPAHEHAALMSRNPWVVADWEVLPPPRWSSLMRAYGSKCSVGLSRPVADTGTRLRYAMGESACVVAELRRPRVVRDPTERGASPVVVLCVGSPPFLRGTTPQVVPAPPATSRALFPGFTL